MIFFSLTEAPLPDPTPTLPDTPKRNPKQTQNGAQTEPKRSRNEAETEPKWSRNQALNTGKTPKLPNRPVFAPLLGGVVREKENHCPKDCCRRLLFRHSLPPKRRSFFSDFPVWTFVGDPWHRKAGHCCQPSYRSPK